MSILYSYFGDIPRQKIKLPVLSVAKVNPKKVLYQQYLRTYLLYFRAGILGALSSLGNQIV